jgi:hypothetical protein
VQCICGIEAIIALAHQIGPQKPEVFGKKSENDL